MIHQHFHRFTSRHNDPSREVSEADLLAEYVDRILCGDHPDLDEYIGCYIGPDPHIFQTNPIQGLAALRRHYQGSGKDPLFLEEGGTR